jgi:hypothetical protein
MPEERNQTFHISCLCGGSQTLSRETVDEIRDRIQEWKAMTTEEFVAYMNGRVASGRIGLLCPACTG